MTGELAPGLVRQDVFAPPARSLLTGVPAFLGRARASKDTPNPLPLTLWPQFEAAFGDSADGYLADAVRGFFDNDGLLCYVVWLSSTVELRDALSLLDDTDEVDLLCAPDLMTAATWPSDADLNAVVDPQRILLEHCEARGFRQ